MIRRSYIAGIPVYSETSISLMRQKSMMVIFPFSLRSAADESVGSPAPRKYFCIMRTSDALNESSALTLPFMAAVSEGPLTECLVLLLLRSFRMPCAAFFLSSSLHYSNITRIFYYRLIQCFPIKQTACSSGGLNCRLLFYGIF